MNKRKIYIDVTTSFMRNFKTGIPRVIVNLIYGLDENYGDTFEVLPFSLESNYFRIHDINTIRKIYNSKPEQKSTAVQLIRNLLNALYIYCALILKAVIPIRSFYKIFYDGDQISIFASCIKKLLSGHKKINPEGILNNIIFTKNDILLLPEVYTDPIWISVLDEFKRHELTTILLVHDINPITHPQYVSNKLRNGFKVTLKMAQSANMILCVSHSTQEKLKKYFSLFRVDRNVSHITLGADFLNQYQSNDHATSEKLLHFFNTDQKIYIAVGTIIPRKNHFFLLTAFNLLWDSGADCRLLLIGSDRPESKDFIELLQAHPEYEKKLFWWDNINDLDLEYCYKNATALLCPSYEEGFGLPIIEALYYNLPVLLSDIDIHHEVAGEMGQYFSLNDVFTLVDLLLDFKKTGINTKELIVSKYNWQNAADKFINEINNSVK